MRDRPTGEQTRVTDSSTGRTREFSRSRMRPIFAGIMLAGVVCAICLRIAAVRGHEWVEVAVAAAAVFFLAMQIPARKPRAGAPPAVANEDLKQIFASAGPMVIGIGLNGSITHFNPAAERLL